MEGNQLEIYQASELWNYKSAHLTQLLAIKCYIILTTTNLSDRTKSKRKKKSWQSPSQFQTVEILNGAYFFFFSELRNLVHTVGISRNLSRGSMTRSLLT